VNGKRKIRIATLVRNNENKKKEKQTKTFKKPSYIALT